MSSNKKNKPEDPPMFDRDPITGKLIPLPLNYNNSQNLSANKNKLRSMTFKDLKPLSSLGLTAADFEEPMEQPAKKRKLETHSVRRGLFNFPTKSQALPTPVTNETSVSKAVGRTRVRKELFTFPSISNGHTLSTNQSNKPNKKKIVLESSLLDLDEVEEMVSSPSTMNFVKMEEMFKSEEIDKAAISSPVTSVCNLLKVTNINTSKIQRSYTKRKDSTKIIRDVICAEKKCFKDFEDTYQDIMKRMELAFKEYKSKHENYMELLNTELNPAETPSTNKENHINPIGRRSVRLQQKSPVSKSNRMLVSPVPTNSENLLKSTLKKNAAARIDNESPRTHKALLMYNSLRNNNGNVLETPRMDRKALLETPKSLEKKSLSWKVQRQCLLLQDTPRPK